MERTICSIINYHNLKKLIKLKKFKGWVEKSSGPCDIFIAAGRGYLRSMKGEGQAVLDIVPVDIVVNLLISAAWNRAKNTRKNILIDENNKFHIYNCTTGGLNPFRWGEMGICY